MSSDVENRLRDCFRTVFSDLPDPSIGTASHATVQAWDSVATITLINVIEDEFGIEFDLDNAAEFDSFDRFLVYVQSRGTG